MTDLRALVEAIWDDPDDDDLRLVFADWLEEHGQGDRATWVRASCELDRRSRGDLDLHSDYPRLLLTIVEAFERCRPEWYQEISGIIRNNERGLFRFELRSKTAAKRLGKVAWLGQALAEGWLERVTVTWSDDLVARAVAAWKGPLGEVPLFVRVAPQIGEEGLGTYLAMPNLRGLDLPSHARRNPCVGRLGDYPGLRELKFEGVARGEDESALMRQVSRLTGLRSLALHFSNGVSDPDLACLHQLTDLRTLDLSGCVTITDAALAHLKGLKKLRKVILSGCPWVTPEGIEALRVDLPSIHAQTRW